MLILNISFSNIQAEEPDDMPIKNKRTLAHVSIKGSGTEFMIMSNFMFGLGRSFFIRLDLEQNSHIEINKILHRSDVIVLDGSHVITLIGFMGYFRQAHRININGIAILAIWK
jgi:hypothetical protein